VPQERVALDQTRWLGLWHRLGAHSSGLEIFEQLAAAYAEPTRVYHTATHLLDCLTHFDSTRNLACRPDEVEAALWFHDAVYVPGAPDNEDRSARLAEAALASGAVSPETGRRVGDLVLATRHLTIPREPDAQLVCDIDLSIFGREPEVFQEFEQRIRREYGWVPETIYRRSRAEVLAGFLHRRPIYQTEYFRARYEVPARRNLERILAELAE
jgi:predicted metal-dependent HD superfamily phosphohydrolase